MKHSIKNIWTTAMVVMVVPTLSFAATINMTWDTPTSGVPTGYIVERRQGPADTWGALAWGSNAPTERVFKDTLTTVTAYPLCYRVRAFNTAGTSTPSNEVCFTEQTPPQNLTGTITGTFTGTFSVTPKP